MKILITYYSYSGHADKVAKIFADELRSKGEVAIQRLRPKDEVSTFAGQCKAAFTRKRAEIENGIKFDAGPYDLIMIGSPVWAFAPTPAMNTYLDNISGATGKRVIIFLTSGSGLGVKKCFNNIKNALRDKGVSKIDEINIPDAKNNDEGFILSGLRKVL